MNITRLGAFVDKGTLDRIYMKREEQAPKMKDTKKKLGSGTELDAQR